MGHPLMIQDRVAALAGRRIDPPGVRTKRFPLDRVAAVKMALTRSFHRHRVGTLVASAACGADLVALDVAGELGLARRIVLPFGVQRFGISSVTDRPGDWGPLYRRIVAEVKAQG